MITKMFLLVTAILLAVFLSGCGQKNTVEAFVVSTVQYTEKADIEFAEKHTDILHPHKSGILI